MQTIPTPALSIDPATRWALAIQYSDENNVGFCDALRIVVAGSDRSLVVANIGDTYSELAKNAAGEWVWVERVEEADEAAADDGYYETKRYLATCAL